MEDEAIINLFSERNEQGISCTKEKYGSRIRSLSYKITKDREACEECENDTYMALWNLIPPNEPKAYFYPFIARITRHISLDYCKKQAAKKRKAYIVELSEEMEMCLPSREDVTEIISEKLLADAISAYLDTISEEKRIIFMRRYFYLDTIKQIASSLQISQSKVKTSLFRTRNDLRNYLIKEGYTL